jgi:NTP pyrophosphatase (non-canonical NTP hydrolase)
MASEMENSLYDLSWKIWGEQTQYGLLAEECCELAKAALKRCRKVNGSTEAQLMEEIVDVELVIESVKRHAHLSQEIMAAIRTHKINRLADILHKEIENG